MEKSLNQLVEKSKQAFGDRLRSIVLYGSAARGEYEARYSDLNVLCVLSAITPAELALAEPILNWWREQGHPSPLLLAADEVATSTDCFPIEFHDIRGQHRILYGADLVAGLTIDEKYYRAQVEYQLRAKLLRLRQKAGGVLSHRDLLARLLCESVTTFVLLMRHALTLSGSEAHALNRRDTVAEAARRFALDAAPFLELLDVREGRRKEREIEPARLFPIYLKQIDLLVRAVDSLGRAPESTVS